ncbi:MraY family glycosyltransferase [Granulicella sp. dw_53]|uniref:MraY family glycosyltransferase n=1 Tax=Granulicella sp. dw_53 TaxID=2719792 RepID=UPI001BD51E24|nr:MraY family glycosyltransferase [Granulicella sp. dw_53]
MNTILALGVTAFILCFILTPLCRDLSLRLNLVDHPDTERKFHKKPIPRVGGVPIVLAYSGALILVFVFTPATQRVYIRHHEILWALLPAAAIIFITGLIDDLIGLKPWQKLAGQFLGAGLAVGLGAYLAPGDLAVSVEHSWFASPWINIPLSLLWLIGCTNAVNLIDGLDGLASGVGLFATVTMLLAAAFNGNTGLLLTTMPLAGCLLAFLCFNFSPASIFLGDCGSLTVGFMLGCFSLVWSQRSGTLLGMAAPLMALALPLIDVGLAICRRYLRKVPIFRADRGHIHHMVQARGFKPRDTALILYGVCALAASLALVQSFQPYLRSIVVIVFSILVWAGVNYLGYIELGAATRALSSRHILGLVREEIYLHDLGRALLDSKTSDDCWMVVKKACAEMRFATIEMSFQGNRFETILDPATLEHEWRITLPLGDSGYLSLSRSAYEKSPKTMISTLDHLQEILVKRAQMQQTSASFINASALHRESKYRIAATQERS